MTTVDFITALFDEIERSRRNPQTPRPTSGPVRSAPWGCSMPSKV